MKTIEYDPKMALVVYIAALCTGRSFDDAKVLMKQYIAEVKGKTNENDD